MVINARIETTNEMVVKPQILDSMMFPVDLTSEMPL
jgi:hypothetical protein